MAVITNSVLENVIFFSIRDSKFFFLLNSILTMKLSYTFVYIGKNLK